MCDVNRDISPCTHASESAEMVTQQQQSSSQYGRLGCASLPCSATSRSYLYWHHSIVLLPASPPSTPWQSTLSLVCKPLCPPVSALFSEQPASFRCCSAVHSYLFACPHTCKMLHSASLSCKPGRAPLQATRSSNVNPFGRSARKPHIGLTFACMHIATLGSVLCPASLPSVMAA